jgi:hypothetical protein
MYLARDHARPDLREAISDVASGGKREELRGLAVACLWDSARSPNAPPPSAGAKAEGSRARARDLADDLVSSRYVGNVAWGALLRAAAKGGESFEPLVSETPFRWIQWGWLE